MHGIAQIGGPVFFCTMAQKVNVYLPFKLLYIMRNQWMIWALALVFMGFNACTQTQTEAPSQEELQETEDELLDLIDEEEEQEQEMEPEEEEEWEEETPSKEDIIDIEID